MKAFDLADENPKVRAAYGENPFVQGYLLARRLMTTPTPRHIKKSSHKGVQELRHS